MNVNPFSYLIEKLKGKVDKSGDIMSGNLTIQENGERYVKCANTGKSTAVFVQSSSDGSHGIFSNGYYDGSFHSEDKWLLVRAGNNKVYVNGSVVPYGGELALKSDINSVVTHTYDYYIGADNYPVTVIKNNKVVQIFFFCDQNIANGTVLCTLPSDERPAPFNNRTDNLLIYLYDGVHGLNINRNSGTVEMINSNNSGMWGMMEATYITS